MAKSGESGSSLVVAKTECGELKNVGRMVIGRLSAPNQSQSYS
jgi:hypothetical protein